MRTHAYRIGLAKAARISLAAKVAAGLFLLLVACMSQGAAFAQAGNTNLKFSFGSEKAEREYRPVAPSDVYTKERGYGFAGAPLQLAKDPSKSSLCAGKPFLFAVDVPEGNYNVTVTLGDRSGESTTTVKAEARRLMLEKIHTARGKFETRTFTVNVRRSRLNSGESVRLKNDEQSHMDWDDQLTLEFNDVRPCVRTLEISKADDVVTVYIAGDSTVTDQAKEPWSAWGQMLPRFFTHGVAVANHAESGESLKSFMGERRLEKVLESIKAGDYLFIQFTHNDQKPGAAHVDPFTTYKETLKHFIDEARKRKALPVLVTSMHRRNFDAEGKIVNTLGDYPEAMRQLAKEETVPLIDLNAMSKTLFEALGPEGTVKAFVHYPAGTFPGQDKELKDNTHFNAYGAYELAKCVVSGIQANKLGLAKFLASDVRSFDPGHPDPLSAWSLPVSPVSSEVKPDGN